MHYQKTSQQIIKIQQPIRNMTEKQNNITQKMF